MRSRGRAAVPSGGGATAAPVCGIPSRGPLGAGAGRGLREGRSHVLSTLNGGDPHRTRAGEGPTAVASALGRWVWGNGVK